MKKSFFICLLVLGLAFQAEAAKQNFGAKVALSNFMELGEFLKDPESYVGKRVLVEGKVVMICAKEGCWMDIESNRTSKIVHIRIPSNMFNFTMSAQDREVHIEGVVERLDMTREEAIVWYSNKAEDAGVDFDPKTITESKTVYIINAHGAELFD